MSATKLVELPTGNSLLETFDFRSEFSFDDFAQWICGVLNVHPLGGIVTEDMEPFEFPYRNSLLRAGWSEEHGCYIEAGSESRQDLEALQLALSE